MNFTHIKKLSNIMQKEMFDIFKSINRCHNLFSFRFCYFTSGRKLANI